MQNSKYFLWKFGLSLHIASTENAPGTGKCHFTAFFIMYAGQFCVSDSNQRNLAFYLPVEQTEATRIRCSHATCRGLITNACAGANLDRIERRQASLSSP